MIKNLLLALDAWCEKRHRAARIKYMREVRDCKHGHKFGTWVDIKNGAIVKAGIPCGLVIQQERRCERCKLVELRSEMTLNKDWSEYA